MTATLCELVRHSAHRSPQAEAFRCGEASLSYAQLVDRADRLAATLRDDGVRPGDRVGIMAAKSVWNAVAVYGIQRAGAAYVPLDPTAPLQRHRAIIDECDLHHIVSDQHRARRLARLGADGDTPTHVYGVDAVDLPGLTTRPWDDVLARAPIDPGVPSPTPDDPAYLIFTSGSTGTPKGIVHTHRSAVAYATMAAELYGLRADDRLSNFPPLHFDQSTFDFFSGPLVGATTVMIGEEHQRLPASLSALIEAERLTVWYSVPFALIQLLLYGVLDERDLSSLRWVIYGGEPFPLKHLRALMERLPGARFSNCYGPAETNQCSFHHLEPAWAAGADHDGAVPIGRMCPGMAGVIVDGAGHEVAPGQAGELLVHSPTTMTGYFRRPEVNARVLVERPGPGGPRRYYRTGDLVRCGDDGLLHFLGRLDRQVKTRGYRVELDEVEAALAGHESVREAAVVAIPGDESATIVAYVLGAGGETGPASTSDLRRHAAALLPKYALPAEITVLDDFPRTTSGKVDYRALGARGGSA